MIEYKAYHKKSLGKRSRRRHAVPKKGRDGRARTGGPRIRQVLPIAAALLGVFLVTAAGAAVYSWLGRSRLFSVREVDMNACAHVTREEVAGILAGGAAGAGGNIWSLSAEEIGRRLRSHAWVRSVRVRKSFPDKIVVRIEENRAVAMINLDALYYVDDEGVVFKRLTAYDPKDFPIVTGFARADIVSRDADALQSLRRAIELVTLADAAAALRRNVSEVHFDAQEGYTLVTRDSGLRLEVGTMNPREAVRRIEEAMPKLSRLGTVPGAVDLKHAGRIFVRPGE